MSHFRILQPLLCVLIACSTSAAGQEAPRVLVGLPTRLTLRCEPTGRTGTSCSAVTGVLLRIDADSLTIRTADHVEQRFSTTALTALAVSRRKHGHVALGLLVGTVAGVALGAVAQGDPMQNGSCLYCYLIAVPSGVVVGGVTGALIRTPVWERVQLPMEHASGRPAYHLGLSLHTPW